jgi:hypothetical protein
MVVLSQFSLVKWQYLEEIKTEMLMVENYKSTKMVPQISRIIQDLRFKAQWKNLCHRKF